MTLFLDAEHRLRNGWRILFFLLALATGLFLLGGVASLLGRPVWMRNNFPPAFVALGVSALALRLEGRTLADLGLRLDRAFLRDLLLGSLGGIVLLGLAALLVAAFGGVRWVPTDGAGLGPLFRAAVFMLGVSLFEELFFRGYAFQRLVDGVGLWPALLLGGALFGLAHWTNPGMAGAVKAWATLNIALAAVLLGLAWSRTRSLALPIGIHLTWNWTQGALLGFGVSGHRAQGLLTPVFGNRPDWFTGGAFGLEASLPGCLVLVVAVAALAAWKGRPARLG